MRSRNEFRLVALLALVLVAVLLDPGHAEAGHAAAIDRALPARELFQAKRIALTSLVDGQKAAGNGGHDLGLPADDPTGRLGRRQAVERQRLAERADNL